MPKAKYFLEREASVRMDVVCTVDDAAAAVEVSFDQEGYVVCHRTLSYVVLVAACVEVGLDIEAVESVAVDI